MDTSSIAKTNIIIDGANVAWELARVKVRHYGNPIRSSGTTTTTTTNNSDNTMIITTSVIPSDDMLIDDTLLTNSSFSSSVVAPATTITSTTDDHHPPTTVPLEPSGPDMEGIHRMMEWWISHGHDVVTILPRSYEHRYPSLQSIFETGQILFSPPGDDLFVITTAKQLEGFIITNDKYRKEALLIENNVSELEANRLREYLIQHCITYTFTVDSQPLLHPVMSLQAMQTERKKGIPSAAEYIKQTKNNVALLPSSIPSSYLPPTVSSTTSSYISSSSRSTSSTVALPSTVNQATIPTIASSTTSTTRENTLHQPSSYNYPGSQISSLSTHTNGFVWNNDSSVVNQSSMGIGTASPSTVSSLLPSLLPELPPYLPFASRQYILSFPDQSINRQILHKYIGEILTTIQYSCVRKDYTYGILPRIKTMDQEKYENGNMYSIPTIAIFPNDWESLLQQFLEYIVSNIRNLQNRYISQNRFISPSEMVNTFVLWEDDTINYLRQGLEYLQKNNK